ncbi:hypothetical protein ACN20G_11700 [Streptomyces sp. BI20]|uniref:hypothetical protein n=1 Tax=Streptomyces sp. BI20 TaxID=3403460 RepID=UPI003C787D67
MVRVVQRCVAVVALMALPFIGATEAQAGPKKWYSTATCGVEQIGKGDHGDKQLKGNGVGKSKGEAEKAAQSDVQRQIASKFGKGFRAHHCTFRTSRR